MSQVLKLAVIPLLAAAMAGASAADASAAGTVARLYRDFGWEAVLVRPMAPLFADQREAALRRYLTAKLAAAVAADATCKAKLREICKLDFMPLWGSQDPVAQDLAITAASQQEVRVDFTTGPGTRTTLLFRMEATKAGWRIADIVYPGGSSLASLLAHPAQASGSTSAPIPR